MSVEAAPAGRARAEGTDQGQRQNMPVSHQVREGGRGEGREGCRGEGREGAEGEGERGVQR